MKKPLSLFLAIVMIASLASCQNQTEDINDEENAENITEETTSGEAATENIEPTEPDAPASTTDNNSVGNILIAYFSVPETDGVDTVSGASRVATEGGVMGNTQFIAQAIQKAVGGDLFAIETVQDYPGTHDALLEYAYQEQRNNARPELNGEVENLNDYDIIFLGYPNWNSELPMPLYTFLESNDFSGKTIIPFVTHGGSGFSSTISTISALQPEAIILEDGLSTSRNNVASSEQAAIDWAVDILN